MPIVPGEPLDLREMLDSVLEAETDHARRLVKCAAIVSEALRREGLEATVVGGSAIEIYAPDAYATRDLDLVVSERFGIDWSAAQARTFQALPASRRREGGGARRPHRRFQVLGSHGLRNPG